MPKPVHSPEITRWLPEARALSSVERAYAVPLEVLFGEAVDVARFHGKYWRSLRDRKVIVRRGLELATGKPGSRLSAKTGDEILSLLSAASDAQTNYMLELDPPPDSAMERGNDVLDELRATLTFFLDDDVEDVDDARLARLTETHRASAARLDGLAMALDDFAGLAALHRDALDGLGGFDAATIDEAHTLAKALRARPAVLKLHTDATRDALDLRDRLVALLFARMSEIRAAARFVFRNEPAIIREVTSAYERRRRAQKRASDKASADEPLLG